MDTSKVVFVGPPGSFFFFFFYHMDSFSVRLPIRLPFPFMTLSNFNSAHHVDFDYLLRDLPRAFLCVNPLMLATCC